MVEHNDVPANAPREPRLLRARKRQRTPTAIEIANKLSNDDFTKQYVKPSEKDWPEWTHPQSGDIYTLNLTRPQNMGEDDLDACFNLVDETSGEAYRSSSVGWHVKVKKTEMRSPDLRYILIKNKDNALNGFTSMMPTFENGQPVVYCFEIHLKPKLQGTGVGSQLMKYLMDAAENIPSIEKVMLTCFASNVGGLKFYERLGFETDDFSPRERKLRGGKTVKPDYVILSRKTSAGRATTIRKAHGDHNDGNARLDMRG